MGRFSMDLLNEQPLKKEKLDHDPSVGPEGKKEIMNTHADDIAVVLTHTEDSEEHLFSDQNIHLESEEFLSEDLSGSHHAETSEKKEGQSEHVEKLLAELSVLPDAESKLKLAISCMEASLAQNGAPNFRNFWDIRKTCLELFKEESILPAARYQLWNKYIELSKEARRLKEILDEQSAFAAEQIDIAIQALEQDIAQLPELLIKAGKVEFPSPINSFEGKKLDFYVEKQKELNLLNAYASRINALRKELIKTEMRIRQKNKFFQRLSTSGDHVFPRRKELIKEISQHFIEDVEIFIQSNFDGEDATQSLFYLREEIKALQGLAKVLTLNTLSFTQTRTRLSSCWDKIKKMEKERKKERAKQKAISRQHVDQVLIMLQELQQSFAVGTVNPEQGLAKLDEIMNFMRSQKLGHEEIRELREEIGKARAPMADKIKSQEQQRQQQEQERNRQKKERVHAVRARINDLIAKSQDWDADRITITRDEILAEIQSGAFIKTEKQDLEKLLKPLRDIISEKKKKKLLELSDGDQQALLQLKSILSEARERRQEIKEQLELLRRASGSSGLDFEQAMIYNEQLNSEKQSLEKINHGIKELEQKINELEDGYNSQEG